MVIDKQTSKQTGQFEVVSCAAKKENECDIRVKGQFIYAGLLGGPLHWPGSLHLHAPAGLVTLFFQWPKFIYRALLRN